MRKFGVIELYNDRANYYFSSNLQAGLFLKRTEACIRNANKRGSKVKDKKDRWIEYDVRVHTTGVIDLGWLNDGRNHKGCNPKIENSINYNDKQV